MIVIGGLAMNAFIEASITFNKDKKNIDSSQNLSAILELIGNDIKQSGEQMNDSKFPVIKIEQVPTGDTVNTVGSSVITIRRALTAPLTLCGAIAAGATSLVVIDTSQSEPNCKLPAASDETTTSLPAGTTVTRANRIKDFRDKRCQVDNINGVYTSPDTTDFCNGVTAEKLLAGVSDQDGHMRTFEYIGDTDKVTSGTTQTYSIQTSATGLSADTTNTYNIGDPIYLLEERTYKLDKNGNFQMKRDNGSFETLIKGMKDFKVSARVYGNKETKESDTINAATPAVAPNLLPSSRRCDSAVPYYICTFNTTTTAEDWKTIQGIKIKLQARYDATGRATEANATTADKEKLEAQAEFFPRNVLSK